MSNRDEIGCLIYLGIGGLFLLLYLLVENPIMLVYLSAELVGIFLIALFLNFLRVLYFINFETKFTSILKFDDNASKTHYDNLLKVNGVEKLIISTEWIDRLRNTHHKEPITYSK